MEGASGRKAVAISGRSLNYAASRLGQPLSLSTRCAASFFVVFDSSLGLIYMVTHSVYSLGTLSVWSYIQFNLYVLEYKKF